MSFSGFQGRKNSPLLFKHNFDDQQQQIYLQQHQRKDSASSEVAALLCISGRTSRLSSVGSQGSAVSRLSTVSGLSRSPSPHRMLLETSFCGPKPVENVVDATGSCIGQRTKSRSTGNRNKTEASGKPRTTGVDESISDNSHEPPIVTLLEKVLLSRISDPTKAILAEGITVPTNDSPKRINTTQATDNASTTTQPCTEKATEILNTRDGNLKSPGQMIIGKTPSGTEYIRINLKPNHMYEDKGIASNEKLVEAPTSLNAVYSSPLQTSQTTIYSKTSTEHTVSLPASSKKGVGGSQMMSAVSRSPSPASMTAQRKSSFSSLFRFGGKDTSHPEPSHERPQSRNKNKDLTDMATPSKQKTVLSLFKTNGVSTKRGSSASAICNDINTSSSRNEVQRPASVAGSRPGSQLRYYDEPVDGYIHIPLHTPPEQKEIKKLFQNIEQLNEKSPQTAAKSKDTTKALVSTTTTATIHTSHPIHASLHPGAPPPITVSDLAAAAAALKPVSARKVQATIETSTKVVKNSVRANSTATKPSQIQRFIENLDSIQSLSHEEDKKEPNWSLEVNRNSSQDSQETVGSVESCVSAIRVVQSGQRGSNQLVHIKEMDPLLLNKLETQKVPKPIESENVGREEQNKNEVEMNDKKSNEVTTAARERRKLLFATRLGSGSEDPMFSTQFSISKTESISSHMSEQAPDSQSESLSGIDNLRRQDTVIKKSDNGHSPDVVSSNHQIKLESDFVQNKKAVQKFDASVSNVESKVKGRMAKSISTSEDEKSRSGGTIPAPISAHVIVRRRQSSSDDQPQKSRSTSEEEREMMRTLSRNRHSRYLENYDPVQQQQQHQYQQPQHRPSPTSSYSKSVGPNFNKSTTPSPDIIRTPLQSPVDRYNRQTPPKPPRVSPPTKRGSPAEGRTSDDNSTVTTPRIHRFSSSHSQRPLQLPIYSTNEPAESSESERDSDSVVATAVPTSAGVVGEDVMNESTAMLENRNRHLSLTTGCPEDHESAGLVSHESFDDELPYVPTTLPEERSHGVSLIPMKDRVHMEVKTCPVERPRSTTPLNPAHLEEYYGIIGGAGTGVVGISDNSYINDMVGPGMVRGEKLRISLPRKNPKNISSTTTNTITTTTSTMSKCIRSTKNDGGKSWNEFAEAGLRGGTTKDSLAKPKPVSREPAGKVTTKTLSITIRKTPTTQRKLSGHWIDFENIPEKRKPPKRITTLPRETLRTTAITNTESRARNQEKSPSSTRRSNADTIANASIVGKVIQSNSTSVNADGYPNTQYNFVKPEECQCECHEMGREISGTSGISGTSSGSAPNTIPTGSTSSTSGTPRKGGAAELLQQGDDMLPLIDPDGGVDPRYVFKENSCFLKSNENIYEKEFSGFQ